MLFYPTILQTRHMTPSKNADTLSEWWWAPHTRFTGRMLMCSILSLSKFIPAEIADLVLEHVVARDVLTFWTLEFQGATRMPVTRNAWLADRDLRSWVTTAHRSWARLWLSNSGPVALRADPILQRKRDDPSLPGFRVVELS